MVQHCVLYFGTVHSLVPAPSSPKLWRPEQERHEDTQQCQATGYHIQNQRLYEVLGTVRNASNAGEIFW